MLISFCTPALGSPCSVLSSVSCLSTPPRSSLACPWAAHLVSGQPGGGSRSSWVGDAGLLYLPVKFQAEIFVPVPPPPVTGRCFPCGLEKLPPCLPFIFFLQTFFCCVTHNQNEGAGILIAAHHTICSILFSSPVCFYPFFYLVLLLRCVSLKNGEGVLSLFTSFRFCRNPNSKEPNSKFYSSASNNLHSCSGRTPKDCKENQIFEIKSMFYFFIYASCDTFFYVLCDCSSG